ncbi:glutamate synthase-related protein [Desulfovibrio ferrophilus]|uniref:Ferredoxin-dependent glutamate synthase n=1 Tax=Desulfovibrio ferrophilus TaxID=241368 RepID=A0A2Z6AVN2_9BACT|nr:glutamate synthase-related protein [Desulfovibrio ferrophilus]BBD07297.1 ferredoxin-dependent glutamate synthase [Desulfovibrio ferrophilus]
MSHWPKGNDVLGTTNRGNAIESGLCTLCRADCKGKCETWLSSLQGRETLYPRDFGLVTAGSGNTDHVGVSYNSLRIQGSSYGAQGMNGNQDKADSGDCLFTDVTLETSFGNEVKTKCRLPFMTGALGSTFIAAKYWDSFAAGCALVGIPIVVGENVVGVDRNSILENGRIQKAPELERRIDTYLRYHDGYGGMIVQMNVEDTRNGVAEYLADKYGDKLIIELKWGQGAKNIGGEIEVTSIDYALFLKQRGYLVDPDPELPEVQEGFKAGAIHSFARHSRLGYTNLDSYEKVQDDFMNSVKYLRSLGFKRITLKTGSYGMESLAMAIKFASEAGLDLLTMDGSGGGTGMSPWNMMEAWGVPSLLLHSKAHQYASLLAERGKRVVDMSFAGGFAKESSIFKALSLGAPFTKLVCMGRGMMIPGFLGTNIEGALHPERREAINGNWDKLPSTVSERGNTADKIFAGYHTLEQKIGKDEMKKVPYGAIAMWTCMDKLSCGLQQLLAGARKFDLEDISRDDIASCNRDTERETGIPFITDVGDEKAQKILLG